MWMVSQVIEGLNTNKLTRDETSVFPLEKKNAFLLLLGYIWEVFRKSEIRKCS